MLWIVLVINAFMFVVELNAGLRAQSLSLTGDSLDMLGDALVYGSTLFVIYKSEKLQAGAAFLKGIIMLASSLAVFVKVVHQFWRGKFPKSRLWAESDCSLSSQTSFAYYSCRLTRMTTSI